MTPDFNNFKLLYDFAVDQGHAQGLGIDVAMSAEQAWKAFKALQTVSPVAQACGASAAEAGAAVASVARAVQVPRETLAKEVPLPSYNPPDRSLEDLDGEDSPESQMPFGKHKGKTFEEIKDEAPGYILWLDENVDRISLPADFVESCRPGSTQTYRSQVASDIYGNDNDDVGAYDSDVPF